MGMPAQKTEWTAEMARALPDDGLRYEVLDGELFVTPAPGWAHQAVLARLFALIHTYVEKHSLGWTRWSPADIEFSPRRLVQPDLFVVPDTGGGEPESWKQVTTLLLVVEATSPSTARADRTKKLKIYRDERIPEYWILDVHGHVVERWRPDEERPEILATTLAWQPDPKVEPLTIDVPDLFVGRKPGKAPRRDA
jgi:Uma2 family endonuclease